MSGISISGTDVANYDLQNFTATTTANITPKPITSSYTASIKFMTKQFRQQLMAVYQVLFLEIQLQLQKQVQFSQI